MTRCPRGFTIVISIRPAAQYCFDLFRRVERRVDGGQPQLWPHRGHRLGQGPLLHANNSLADTNNSRCALGARGIAVANRDSSHQLKEQDLVALVHAPGRLTVGAPADVLASKSLSDTYGIAVTTCVLHRAGRPDVPHVVVEDGDVSDG
jgi:hypothetical protein